MRAGATWDRALPAGETRARMPGCRADRPAGLSAAGHSAHRAVDRLVLKHPKPQPREGPTTPARPYPSVSHHPVRRRSTLRGRTSQGDQGGHNSVFLFGGEGYSITLSRDANLGNVE